MKSKERWKPLNDAACVSSENSSPLLNLYKQSDTYTIKHRLTNPLGDIMATLTRSCESCPINNLQKSPHTHINLPDISVDVKEMLKNNPDFQNIYTFFMNEINNYMESKKYEYSIRLYLKKDPEIKGWEEITIDIKVKEPQMNALLKSWKEIDNKVSNQFKRILDISSLKKREQLREINKRIHIKLTNK